jgi:methionyl aminopeptidase
MSILNAERIILKTERELEVLEENARLLADILVEVALAAVPGVSTGELDRLAERLIRQAGAEPAFKGFQDELHPRPYPATLCASLNQEVVHGLPGPDRVLREGDLLSLDLGLVRKGYCADAAVTVEVGEVSPEGRRLVEVAWGALQAGVAQARIGQRVSDISHAIGAYVRKRGFFVIRELVGHGIGRKLHEPPQIPNFGPPGRGPRLQEGMVLCLEPMIQTKDGPIRAGGDGWTVVTASGGLAAHCEEMVAITPAGPRVLTGWIQEEIWRRRK